MPPFARAQTVLSDRVLIADTTADHLRAVAKPLITTLGRNRRWQLTVAWRAVEQREIRRTAITDAGIFRADALAGRVAVVTGAGSGIGAAIACAVADAGASVVTVGRDRERLQATVTAIESAGGTAMSVVADVAMTAPSSWW